MLGKSGQPTFLHYQPGGGGGPLEDKPNFRGKLVVVGSLDKDSTELEGLSGTEILAFAINELILPFRSHPERKELLLANNPFIFITLVAGSAVSALTLFWILFSKLAYIRNKLWLLAILSAVACLLVLIVFVWFLFSLNHIYPQITLLVISILISVGLFWFYLRRGIELELITPDIEKSQPLYKEFPAYDVFISYANTDENYAWVNENIYKPLLNLKKADGSDLRVFLDKQPGTMKVATGFYSQLAKNIERSRFFLPVYTSDYFTKDFCKFEMERAALRHVKLGDFIIPIAREKIDIPIEYNHIHYLDIRMDPKFMDQVIERIRIRGKI